MKTRTLVIHSKLAPKTGTQFGLAPTQTTKKAKIQKKECKEQNEVEVVRITRSSPKSMSRTPSSLYDFVSESPVNDSNKNTGKKSGSSKIIAKNVKKKVEKSQTRVSSAAGAKSKGSIRKTGEVAKPTVTPKGRVSRAVVTVESMNSEKELKGNKRLRALKPIPQPNLDDISPIVRERKSTTPSRKRAADLKQKGVENVEKSKKKLRSSKGSELTLISRVSFAESNDYAASDDSAIFVSPRQTMPRFEVGKTSTPADIPSKAVKKTAKKLSKISARDTSTPNESKPKRAFTGIKDNISKLSPVQRVETPTSDYGSMEVIETPSPTLKGNTKKRASSPAFTLDDDSEENLNLNKSVDKSYKKSHSRRKYETSGRFSTSKLDEWAEKVNSELDDIENFELSVEG